MTIVDDFKTISEEMDHDSGKPWTFADAENYEINEQEFNSTDNAAPFFFLLHPIIARLKKEKFISYDVFEFQFFLLEKSLLKDKNADRQPRIQRMYDAKKQLAELIEQAGYEIVSLMSEEVYNAFDRNYDGLECTIQLKNVQC